MSLTNALVKKMAVVGVVKEDGMGKPVFISSGSMGLDIVMGGGLPRCQLTTISSAIPGYGKDTLVNLFIKAITTAPPGAMTNGGPVLIFNQERKMSGDWLRKMGADLSKVDIV